MIKEFMENVQKDIEKLNTNSSAVNLEHDSTNNQPIEDKVYIILRHSNEETYVFECYKDKSRAEFLVHQYNKEHSYGVVWDENFIEPEITDDEYSYFELQSVVFK